MIQLSLLIPCILSVFTVPSVVKNSTANQLRMLDAEAIWAHLGGLLCTALCRCPERLVFLCPAEARQANLPPADRQAD
jgi:hypothetical protein